MEVVPIVLGLAAVAGCCALPAVLGALGFLGFRHRGNATASSECCTSGEGEARAPEGARAGTESPAGPRYG